MNQGTCFLLAAHDGNINALADLLLGVGVDFTQRDQHTALMIAVKQSHHAIVEFLLDNDAEIDRTNLVGHTALTFAIMKHDDQMVKLLLGRGASVHRRDASGSTPFIIAAKFDNTDALVSLAKHGSKINASNYRGETALIMAVKHGKCFAVQTLIGLGVNKFYRDIKGNDAVKYALTINTIPMDRILELFQIEVA